MNTLQEMIDVMTAARDGNEIECRQRGGDGWVSTNRSLYFNWVDYTYRVKPEPPKPREWWIQLDRDSGYVLGVYTQKFVAFGKVECVHVKEVL